MPLEPMDDDEAEAGPSFNHLDLILGGLRVILCGSGAVIAVGFAGAAAVALWSGMTSDEGIAAAIVSAGLIVLLTASWVLGWIGSKIPFFAQRMRDHRVHGYRGRR